MAPGLQISIPTTSTATPSDSKPYTVYHIVLQLPLRKHEIRKRYTDFANLHHALTTETNTASGPPAPMPPKSWFRRTINNPAQLESRRQGLEQYLRAILNADDARWRSSAAWRAFLNLPGGQNTTLHANGTLSARNGSVGGGGIGNENTVAATSDPNRWVDVHRELKTQMQGARQRLKQREAATTAQAQHTLAAEAKAGLVRAAASIAQLDDGLKAIATASRGDDAGWGGSQKLGEGEIRRRRDLIAAAKKEVEGLEGVLKSMATKAASASSSANTTTAAAATATEKEGLWKGTNAAAKPGGRVLGGPLKETERTREHDNAGVLQLQKQIMQEQDEDVLTLGKTVARLKDMGIMINEELTIQNEMLNIVEQDTDRVQGKVDVARNRIKRIK